MKRVKQIKDEAPADAAGEVAAREDARPTSPPTAVPEGGAPADANEAVATTGAATAGDMKKGAREVADAAKVAKSAVTELFGRVFDMEQMALFNQPEFEEALLMDAVTLRKKYTGEQAEKLEWRRDACLYMLSRDCPKEEIAAILRMNFRTVEALAAQNGRLVGAFTEGFAKHLVADAASDIALARTKRDSASYKDLHIGAGIKLQHAAALKIVVDSSGADKPSEDIEADHPGLVQLRQQMKAMKSAGGDSTTKTPSDEGNK